MAINKVEFDGQTLIDLTGDTVTQQDVLNGKSFHSADGVQRSGTASAPVSDVTVDGTSVVTNGVAEVVTDNLAPTVTEASSRTNLAVGDSLKTIIGKIKKFFSDLKTVAFTGSYNDLSDQPTIPSVGNGTLTIQKNGTNVQTFTANQSGNATANITVPTKTSDITNDSGYLTSHQSLNPIVHIVSDIPEGATNLSNTATAHRITAYQNGLSIPYQMDNTNDGGILRVRGTSESNCIFEMGTWDDSGAGETIQFNYYPTTSQVTPTYSVSVPKKSGTIALTSDIPDVSGKVNKSGDTMSGVLNLTYKSASWKNSWYNSAISLEDSTGSFGGWICGPTKNGRIAIQTYQSDNDKLYIGYATRGRTTNSNERQVCWNGATGKWECDITGNCDGTADKANKDGSGNTITSTYLKKTGDTITGNLNIGSGGGYLNASASNGGINSIMIGDDVWLGDCNLGGIMGMKSTGANCGFRFYNSSGTHIGTLQSTAGTLQFNNSNVLVDGGTINITHQINVKNGAGILLYNAANNNYSDIYNSDNGTTFLRSAYGWVNICTNNSVQCRNFGDSNWVPCAGLRFDNKSSRRYKTNIIDFEEKDAKKLLSIKVVHYDYSDEVTKDKNNKYNQSGVIAEDVASIIPEVVGYAIPYGHEDEFDEPVPDTVDYSKFVPYLIKMVQMQQKEIDQLKAEVAELKR
jgi:hypothetical protein